MAKVVALVTVAETTVLTQVATTGKERGVGTPIELWKPYAACRGNTALFYSDFASDIKAAKEICVGCEMRRVCLEYALSHHEHEGVWGGLSGLERRSFIRRRQRRRRLGL